MTSSRRYFLFNQMAGPLFRELAIAVAEDSAKGAVLYTGHPDTVALGPEIGALQIAQMPGYDRRSKLRRLLSWGRYTLRALREIARMKRSDVAILVSNPPTMGPVAWFGRLFGRRYYVLVYDLHPDALINMGGLSETGLITRLWRWMNRRVWNGSEGVITLGDRMARRLERQFSADKTRLGRVEVVPIWVDTYGIKPLERSANSFANAHCVGDKVVVLYSGNMGFSHDIDSILAAAEMLSDREDIAFFLIGEGAKWQDAYDFAESRGLGNLSVLPFQPEEVLPYSLAMADIALVSLDQGAEGLMIPSKTYYYMAAGAALLAICEGESELTDTVAAAECGVQVKPGQPEQLAAEIRALADNRLRLNKMKQAARAHCVAHHKRSVCTQRFLDVISEEGPASHA